MNFGEAAGQPAKLGISEGVLLAYCVLAPITPALPAGVATLALTDILLPVSLVIIIAGGRLRPYPPMVFLMLYVTVALVSVLNIGAPALRAAAGLRAVRLLGITIPFVLAAAVQRPGIRLLRRCTIAFVASGAISLVAGLIVFWWQLPTLTSTGMFRYPFLGLAHRAGGIVGGGGSFGHLTATWFAVTIFLVPVLIRPKTALFLVPAAVALTVVSLLASVSRSAALNVIIVLAAGMVILRKRWPGVTHELRRATRVAVVSLVVLLAIVLFAFGEQLLALVRGRFYLDIIGPLFGEGSIEQISSGRVANWRDYSGLFLRNPISGIGYKSLILVHAMPPDNNYLEALVETGLLGLAGLLGFFASLGLSFYRKDKGGRFPSSPFLIIWIGQAVHAFFGDTLTFWASMPPLLIITMLGLRVSSAKLIPSEPPASRLA